VGADRLAGHPHWSKQWVENVESTTLKLFRQRPLAIPRFEDLCEGGMIPIHRDQLLLARRNEWKWHTMKKEQKISSYYTFLA
jgi:hypothetical protein